MPTVFDTIFTRILGNDEANGLRDALKLSRAGDFCVGYLNLRGWRQIDETYTCLSECYKPTRKSRSDNVFNQVIFSDENLILPLSVRRERKEAEAEADLSHQTGELPLKAEL